MSNTLRRGFYSGLIGGMAAGVWIFVYILLNDLITHEWSEVSALPYVVSFDFWLNFLIFQFGLNAIYGSIVGLVYSRFYDGIPGKGVVKGLVFGLLVGMFADIVHATYYFLHVLLGYEMFLRMGVLFIEGFLKWILYGIILGFVYERLKL